MNLDEKEFRRLCLDGSKDALEKIHSNFLNEILRIILIKRNKLDLFEDFSSEIYILFIEKILKNIDFSKEKIFSFVYTLIKNHVINSLRRQKVRSFYSISDNSAEIGTMVSKEPKEIEDFSLKQKEVLNKIYSDCPEEYLPMVEFVIDAILNYRIENKSLLSKELMSKFNIKQNIAIYSIDLSILLIRLNCKEFKTRRFSKSKYTNPYLYILEKRYGEKLAKDIYLLFFGIFFQYKPSTLLKLNRIFENEVESGER